MDRRIAIRAAKGHLSELLRGVRRGEDWIITEHGRPVARLGPIHARTLTEAERVRSRAERGMLGPLDHEVRVLTEPLPLDFGLAARWLREDREHGR